MKIEWSVNSFRYTLYFDVLPLPLYLEFSVAVLRPVPY